MVKIPEMIGKFNPKIQYFTSVLTGVPKAQVSIRNEDAVRATDEVVFLFFSPEDPAQFR